MSYLKEEIKAGIIIVSSFIILAGFVIVIGGSQFLDKNDYYFIKVMNASGAETGTQVKLGGVRIGKITEIKIPTSPGAPITIKFGIKQGTALFKGTVATITSSGVVGDSFLLLSIDNTKNGQFKPGDTIPSEEQTRFDVLVARLSGISKSVEELLARVHLIFSQKNLKEVDMLLSNSNNTIVKGASSLEKITTSLHGTTVKLDSVINELDSLIKENRPEVSLLVKNARARIVQAEKLITAIEATAKDTSTTVKTADRVIERQSHNLELLLKNLNTATENLQEVIHDLQSKPWGLLYKEKQGKEE